MHFIFFRLREKKDFSLWEKPEGAGPDLVADGVYSCLIPADYALMVHQVFARKICQMILEDYQVKSCSRHIFISND
ncbi:hypothetical protein Peur_010248 [Populus x canadensis]